MMTQPEQEVRIDAATPLLDLLWNARKQPVRLAKGQQVSDRFKAGEDHRGQHAMEQMIREIFVV